MGVNRFRRNFGGKSTYICGACGKRTRETGQGEEGCDLCAAYFERAGWENHHNDNAHDDKPEYRDNPDCPLCIEAGYFKKDDTVNSTDGTGTASPKTKEDPMANKTTGNAAKAKTEVARLVKKLEALENKSNAEGRAIRRMLRKLGHTGGTRKPRKAAKKAKK